MRILIADGPDAGRSGVATVDRFGIVIDGRGYCALDDLEGVVIVELTLAEEWLLGEHGFVLARLH